MNLTNFHKYIHMHGGMIGVIFQNVGYDCQDYLPRPWDCETEEGEVIFALHWMR